MVTEELEGRESGSDPCVVGNAIPVERDVEVRANENRPVPDLGVTDRARETHYAASLFTRSTSRHE